MLAALLIVFREVIEAGLIVGIVLAATRGVAGRGLWTAGGVAGGVLGACLVALFADTLSGLFEGSGQELFNATILLVAVMMLVWHNVWMASHGRQMAMELREAGHAVRSGERTLLGLAVVVGVAVLREGAEVVLFLYGIVAQGGVSTAGLLLGGALGIVAGAILSSLMYFGLVSIPAHRLFGVTSGLITLLAAGMAAQAVLFLQQAGYAMFWMDTLWDTSGVLPESGIVGKLLHTLVGYSDAPNGAQLAAYAGVIILMLVLTRLVGARHRRERLRPKPA